MLDTGWLIVLALFCFALCFVVGWNITRIWWWLVTTIAIAFIRFKFRRIIRQYGKTKR